MPTKQKPRPAARRPQRTDEPWMRRSGGFDALSDDLQKAARQSYERWKEQNADAARRHDLRDYCSYVQDRQAEQAEQAEQNADAAEQAAIDASENAQPPEPPRDGIAPASASAGDDRRRRFLADLLANHYPSPPPDLARLIEKIDRDPHTRAVTLRLADASIFDFGDRLEHNGKITPQVAEATAAAAAAHGWNSVHLTGSEQYRDAIASACAMRQPPITTDHTLSLAAAQRVAEALRQRAAAAVPTLTPAALKATATQDPDAAALTFLSHVEAKARAALAGRPSGSTDPGDISRPQVAELIHRRDQAKEDAREATAAAAAHRKVHGWASRLLDGPARRRQITLDHEANRLDREARRLDRTHEKSVRQVKKAARRTAIANATAVEDWCWSRPVRQAEAQLTAAASIRAAIAGGDEATIGRAALGDFSGATKAALAQQAAAAPPQDPRESAIRALHAAEVAVVRDPDALSRARQATAAALAGDETTISAAARGDLGAAQTAAVEWKRQQQEEQRQRQEALGAERTVEMEPEPEAPAYS
jgi:Large polyvalent protein-associated domain 7